MKKNVGYADSYIRYLIGFALILNIFVLEPGIIGTIVLAVSGVALLFTAFARFCSLYIPFKICTAGNECKTNDKKE